MKKIFLSVFIFLFSVFQILSQENESLFTKDWLCYKSAEERFDAQDYGTSLRLLNDAKKLRVQRIKSESGILESAYTPAEVKYAGSTFSATIPVLQEREVHDALKIIDRYFSIYGQVFFKDSPDRMIEFIKGLDSFPEADFLSGKIYMIEGDYAVAEKYYKNAFDHSENLFIPDEKYEILKSLVELSELDKNNEKVEEYLLLIVSKDVFYRNSSRMKTVDRFISNTDSDCIERFFKMFRNDSYDNISSYIKLSTFYEERHENQKALEACAVGVITGFTKILDVVEKRNPSFEYNDLSGLFTEISYYEDIVNWGIENSLWACFNKLAELALINTDVIFSRQLYTVLKDKNPEEYWRKDAAVKLQDFAVEEKN